MRACAAPVAKDAGDLPQRRRDSPGGRTPQRADLANEILRHRFGMSRERSASRVIGEVGPIETRYVDGIAQLADAGTGKDAANGRPWRMSAQS